MNKKQRIAYYSNKILNQLNEDMTDEDIYNFVGKIAEEKPDNKLIKKIQARTMAVGKGILKIKKYGWEPTDKFRNILEKIGYFNE